VMQAGRRVSRSMERRPAVEPAADVATEEASAEDAETAAAPAAPAAPAAAGPADVEVPALEDVSAALDAPAPGSQDSAAHLEPGRAYHRRRPGKPLHTHPAATWWTAGSTERAAKPAMSEPPGSPERRAPPTDKAEAPKQRALPTEKTAGPLAARPAHRAGVEPARR